MRTWNFSGSRQETLAAHNITKMNCLIPFTVLHIKRANITREWREKMLEKAGFRKTLLNSRNMDKAILLRRRKKICIWWFLDADEDLTSIPALWIRSMGVQGAFFRIHVYTYVDIFLSYAEIWTRSSWNR